MENYTNMTCQRPQLDTTATPVLTNKKENITSITMEIKEMLLTNRIMATKILGHLTGNTDELEVSSPRDESCLFDTVSNISELAKDIDSILGTILVSLGV